MSVCICFLIIITFKKLLLYLFCFIVIAIIVELISSLKDVFEEKTKFYISYSHNYYIENNQIKWINSLKEIKFKNVKEEILVHLISLGEKEFIEKNINLDSKKILKENSDKIGDIFSKDRLINFLNSTKFKDFLERKNIDYSQINTYITEINLKECSITDILYKINNFLKDKTIMKEY